MITLTYADINPIMQSLIPLSNTTKPPVKDVYYVGKLLSALKKHAVEFNELHDKILRDMADKDEAGEPIVINGNQYKFENAGPINAKIAELSKTEIYIEGKHFDAPREIKLSSFQGIVTAKIMADCEKVIDFLEDEEPKDNVVPIK